MLLREQNVFSLLSTCLQSQFDSLKKKKKWLYTFHPLLYQLYRRNLFLFSFVLGTKGDDVFIEAKDFTTFFLFVCYYIRQRENKLIGSSISFSFVSENIVD